MNFEDLKNPELQEKLKSAKTPEDILTMAKEEGFELSDDELEGVSGGFWGCRSDCSEYEPAPITNEIKINGDNNVIDID